MLNLFIAHIGLEGHYYRQHGQDKSSKGYRCIDEALLDVPEILNLELFNWKAKEPGNNCCSDASAQYVPKNRPSQIQVHYTLHNQRLNNSFFQ